MAQALIETIFDLFYLIGVVTVGVVMLKRAGDDSLIKKFGWMAIILGLGDAFHLIPRMYALWTSGLEANAEALGFGKFITSITMTIFYLLLYYIWRERFEIKNRSSLTISMWILTIVRIALCLLPNNEWLVYQQPIFYGILRNIPFAIMGVVMIVLFYQESKKHKDTIFQYMHIAILLSFAFYIPVVLWGSLIPILGMLMIPKTLAYVWIVCMGWKLCQKGTGN